MCSSCGCLAWLRRGRAGCCSCWGIRECISQHTGSSSSRERECSEKQMIHPSLEPLNSWSGLWSEKRQLVSRRAHGHRAPCGISPSPAAVTGSRGAEAAGTEHKTGAVLSSAQQPCSGRAQQRPGCRAAVWGPSWPPVTQPCHREHHSMRVAPATQLCWVQFPKYGAKGNYFLLLCTFNSHFHSSACPKSQADGATQPSSSV